MVAPECSLVAGYYARQESALHRLKTDDLKENVRRNRRRPQLLIQSLKVTAEFTVLSWLYNANWTITGPGYLFQGLDVCNFLLSFKWFRISRFHNKHSVVLSLLTFVIIVGKLQSPEINLVQCDL